MNNWIGKESVEPILLQAGDTRLLINGRPPLVLCRVVSEEKYQAILLDLDSIRDQLAKQEVAFRETVKIQHDEIKQRDELIKELQRVLLKAHRMLLDTNYDLSEIEQLIKSKPVS